MLQYLVKHQNTLMSLKFMDSCKNLNRKADISRVRRRKNRKGKNLMTFDCLRKGLINIKTKKVC
jgi:hypothetical protein